MDEPPGLWDEIPSAAKILQRDCLRTYQGLEKRPPRRRVCVWAGDSRKSMWRISSNILT